MFDPWTATFEGAFAEMDKWRASGADTCRSPIRQISVAHKVLFLKQAIDGGDGFAVVVAISHCVTSGLVAVSYTHLDVYKRQHKHGDAVRLAYDRGDFLEERRKMMTWWADECDRMRQGAEIIPMVRGA